MVEQSEMNADDHVDCCNTRLASEKKTSSTGSSLQSNDWAQGRTSQFYSLFELFQRGVQHETSIGRARACLPLQKRSRLAPERSDASSERASSRSQRAGLTTCSVQPAAGQLGRKHLKSLETLADPVFCYGLQQVVEGTHLDMPESRTGRGQC
jgi:hypothetical protein